MSGAMFQPAALRQRGVWAGRVLLALALCAAVASVFWPLLKACFFLDDFVRLYDLANYGLVKLLISPHGGHLLLASNGVYALFWSLFDLEPWRWFAAVLALHALNTLLFLGLLRHLGCRRLVAVTMAAFWGLCPAQAAALGWMAVFGHVLLGTVLLLLVRDIAGAARRGGRVGGGRALLWWLLAFLAATSFASGLGVAMVVPLAAALLLPGRVAWRPALPILATLVVVVPALYAAQHALYARLFDVAPFMTPVAAIAIEPRRLPGQVAQMAWLALDMLAYSLDVLLLGSRWSGLSVDARPWLALSPAQQNAWLLVPAAVLAVLAASALWRAPRRVRAQALALLLLAVAAHAMLAAGGVLTGRLDTLHLEHGWSLSSAVIRQAMQPRYQYVPTLFLAAVLALAAEAAAARGSAGRRATVAMLFAALVWLALRAPADRVLVGRMGASTSFHRGVVQRLEAEIESAPPHGYLANKPMGAALISMHEEAFPGQAALFVIYHPSGAAGGKTVRFVESDPALLAVLRAQAGTPIARLVVAPSAVPDSGTAPDG